MATHADAIIDLRRERWTWDQIGQKYGKSGQCLVHLMRDWEARTGSQYGSDVWRQRAPRGLKKRVATTSTRGDAFRNLQPQQPHPAAVAVMLNYGFVAWIDPEDLVLVQDATWGVTLPNARNKALYARTMRVMPGGSRVYQRMHRVIMGAPDGIEVDHIDRNGLNNTRANLRFASRTIQTANRVVRPGRSGYRGVRLMENGRFGAIIRHEHVSMWLGVFDTIEEAARAYDRSAIELRGADTVLNFPRKADPDSLCSGVGVYDALTFVSCRSHDDKKTTEA